MSFQAKRTIGGMVVSVALMIGYCLYAFGRVGRGEIGEGDLSFWGVTMLVFIGIGVASMIALQIGLVISVQIRTTIEKGEANEDAIRKSVKSETTEDEMDKLIARKSAQISYGFLGAGFLAALVVVAVGLPTAVMLNILFFSGCVGGLCEGAVTIYYYKAGV